MELVSFKTNINSESALSKVAPFLNHTIGPANWQLDLKSSKKILTVFSNSIINEMQVEEAVEKAGFRVINLEDYYSIY